jgi:YHS domain-containing protein
MLSNRKANSNTSRGDGGCCSSTKTSAGNEASSCCATNATSHEAQAAIDPVCGMTVDAASPPGGSIEVDGERVYFCSTFCKARFASGSVAEE